MIEQHYGGHDGFWAYLVSRRQDGCLLGCSIKGYGKEGPQIIDGKPTGLILNHAYGLNDIMELKDPFQDPKEKPEPLKLLRIRNPWGKSEWLGKWSDASEEAKKYRGVIDEYIHTLPPDEQYDPDADDGTFLMDFHDWHDNFSTLFVNLDFPDIWTGVRFRSKWTKSNAGGLPVTYTKEECDRYATNPQFMLRPAFDTELMCSLTQTGGRLPIDG
jgi:hypothetical protein